MSGKDILTGRAWNFNGNGFPGILYISINDNGNVQGDFADENGSRNLPLTGTWGEDSRQLTFSRTLDNGEVQTFTGYLFDQPVQNSYALAGTFVGHPFEDPRRPAFGWFATGLVSPIRLD